jgi:hypothetical protein
MMKLISMLVCALVLALPIDSRAAAPAATPVPDQGKGWKVLFDGKSTAAWKGAQKAEFPADKWAVEDGWLHGLGKGGGDIHSKEVFEQFELTWEWKIAAGGNSGLKYFVIPSRGASIGHEYQMLDDDKHPDAKLGEGKRVTASFYDVLKPAKTPLKAPGEINESRILVQGNHVEHWLNGEKVLEYECGSAEVKAAVANSKFKTTAQFGERVKGHLLLQDHGDLVWVRNIKIREVK